MAAIDVAGRVPSFWRLGARGAAGREGAAFGAGAVLSRIDNAHALRGSARDPLYGVL